MKPRKLTVPDARVRDVRLLVSLPSDTVGSIQRFLTSRDALSEAEPTFVLLARATGLSHLDAMMALSAIRNLAKQREDFRLSDDELLADLEALVEQKVGDNAEALVRLIRDSEETHFVEKVSRLRRGLLPHLLSHRTVCDIRPVFDEKRERIEAALVVTYLELEVHDDEYRTVVVQLTETDIQALEKTLAEARSKITCMKDLLAERVSLLA